MRRFTWADCRGSDLTPQDLYEDAVEWERFLESRLPHVRDRDGWLVASDWLPRREP